MNFGHFIFSVFVLNCTQFLFSCYSVVKDGALNICHPACWEMDTAPVCVCVGVFALPDLPFSQTSLYLSVSLRILWSRSQLCNRTNLLIWMVWNFIDGNKLVKIAFKLFYSLYLKTLASYWIAKVVKAGTVSRSLSTIS